MFPSVYPTIPTYYPLVPAPAVTPWDPSINYWNAFTPPPPPMPQPPVWFNYYAVPQGGTFQQPMVVPPAMPAGPVFMPSPPKRKFKEARASHILVKSRAEAERLRQQILAGRDFGEVARQFSQCPSKAKGGDLGYFKRGEMVEQFEKAAFEELPLGVVSTPVKTDFGWHLIKVTDQR